MFGFFLLLVLFVFFFFFFKQKTAYELRISDWSSDVCSSDLIHRLQQRAGRARQDRRRRGCRRGIGRHHGREGRRACRRARAAGEYAWLGREVPRNDGGTEKGQGLMLAAPARPERSRGTGASMSRQIGRAHV